MPQSYRTIVGLVAAFMLLGTSQKEALEVDDTGMLGIVLAEAAASGAAGKGVPPGQALEVFAKSVLPGSAADKAGIKAQDVIVEFDGKPLPTVSTLQSLASKTKPGTKVTMSIRRNGKNETLAVIMGSRKEFESMTTTSFLGKPAPNLTGVDTKTGKSVSLGDYVGRPVLIEMWATWCPTCRTNIRRLNSMTESYKSQKLAILAVSHEEMDVLKKFEAKHPMNYQSIRSEETSLHRAYWANAIPTFIYVDPNGTIQKVSVGDEGLPEIENALKALK